MLIYAGIDEAGYGPMFGPLTVGCATIVLPDYDPTAGAPKLWDLLPHAVCREAKAARGRIIVNDSKKLKLAKDGKRHPLTHLERGVWTFALGSVSESPDWPATDEAWYECLDLPNRDGLKSIPWYGGDPIAVPVAHDIDGLAIASNMLRRDFERAGIASAQLTCRMLTAPEFNERVSQLRSKAAANFGLVAQHLYEILHTHGEHHPRVIIDRQGGRSRYREPLATLFPDCEIKIIAEEPKISRYEMHCGEKRLTVSFCEGAEERHLPVALASMLAKYVRELMMMRFNRYFQAHMPELKPTAGYVQDGRRFLAEIGPVIRSQDLDRARLVRSR